MIEPVESARGIAEGADKPSDAKPIAIKSEIITAILAGLFAYWAGISTVSKQTDAAIKERIIDNIEQAIKLGSIEVDWLSAVSDSVRTGKRHYPTRTAGLTDDMQTLVDSYAPSFSEYIKPYTSSAQLLNKYIDDHLAEGKVISQGDSAMLKGLDDLIEEYYTAKKILVRAIQQNLGLSPSLSQYNTLVTTRTQKLRLPHKTQWVDSLKVETE